MYVRDLFLTEKGLARSDLIAIISHVLSLSKEQVLMEPQRFIDPPEGERIRDLVGQRKEGKPLAYITNEKEFFSEPFFVDERVLIPRPETELLVEEALNLVRARARELTRPVRVLDMGTGSGIIGILLARGGADSVICVDVSTGALVVAKKNAAALGVGEKTLFLNSDLFSSMSNDTRFDLICANLPYIGQDEWDGLMVDVKHYEPEKALLGGKTGAELYLRFAKVAVDYLAPGGAILCEIGGEEQAAVLERLLEEAGLEVTVMKDLAGRQRVVRGSWTSSS